MVIYLHVIICINIYVQIFHIYQYIYISFIKIYSNISIHSIYKWLFFINWISYVYFHIYVHICMHVFTLIYIYVYLGILLETYNINVIYNQICTYFCVYMLFLIFAWISIYIYIYTCLYVYLYIYTCLFICVCLTTNITRKAHHIHPMIGSLLVQADCRALLRFFGLAKGALHSAAQELCLGRASARFSAGGSVHYTLIWYGILGGSSHGS